jgi:hypothetical protein
MKRAILALLVVAAVAAAGMSLIDVRSKLVTVPSDSVEPLPGKYAEAKDLIRRARVLLTDVVRENPGTGDAYYARLQAGALENIFKTDVPVPPVALEDPIVWRVLRVEPTEAYTKVTVEIENTSEDGAAQFYTFERYPLILVADRSVYLMKKNALERPSNVDSYGDDRWSLQPTQAIKLDLYFDALDRGALEGMLKYAHDAFREKPARFSRMNVHQSAAPKSRTAG